MISELLPGLLSGIHFRWGEHRASLMGLAHRHVFDHIEDPAWAAFSYSVSILVICFVPVWVLYRRRIFVKV
jgi:hypothetical protein